MSETYPCRYPRCGFLVEIKGNYCSSHQKSISVPPSAEAIILYRFEPNETERANADRFYGPADEYVVTTTGVFGWYQKENIWRLLGFSPLPVIIRLLHEKETLTGERNGWKSTAITFEKKLSEESDNFADQLTKLEVKLSQLKAENDRLHSGDFTEVEIHNICHNLHLSGKVTARQFANGCVAEQRKLYGRAPDRDANDALAALLTTVEEERSSLAEEAASWERISSETADGNIDLAARLKKMDRERNLYRKKLEYLEDNLGRMSASDGLTRYDTYSFYGVVCYTLGQGTKIRKDK